MPDNKPRSQYKKNRRGFYGERPQEKNRTTESGCGYENQPGSSQRRSERLSHLEKPTVEPLVACSNLEGYKFIYSNVLNELISNVTHFVVYAKAILCN